MSAANRLEILGTFPLRPGPEDYARCAWCGAGTATRMQTPGRPDLGSVPLHAVCAGEIILAFREWRAGGLPAGDPVRGRLVAVGLLGPSS